eukprot:SAG11_NODE_10572_length_820_cov_1.411928_1_plen_23_part_10
MTNVEMEAQMQWHRTPALPQTDA